MEDYGNLSDEELIKAYQDSLAGGEQTVPAADQAPTPEPSVPEEPDYGQMSDDELIAAYQASLNTPQQRQGTSKNDAAIAKAMEYKGNDDVWGELGKSLFTAEGVKELAKDNPSAKAYAYAGDLLNSLAGGLIEGGAGIVEAAGNIVGSESTKGAGRAGKEWVQKNLPNDMLDTSGGGVVNKILETGKGVAHVTGEFLPAMIPGVGEAYAGTLIASGAVNAAVDTYNEAIENGLTPDQADRLAAAKGAVDALGNMLLMGKFKGIWKRASKNAAKDASQGFVRRMAGLSGETAKTGAIMGVQGAANEAVDQQAQARGFNLDDIVGRGIDGFVEGGMFHLVNTGARKLVKSIAWRSPAETPNAEDARLAFDTPEGRALLYNNSPEAAEAIIKAREAGMDVTPEMLVKLGVPKEAVPTAEDCNAVADAMVGDFKEWNSWVEDAYPKKKERGDERDQIIPKLDMARSNAEKERLYNEEMKDKFAKADAERTQNRPDATQEAAGERGASGTGNEPSVAEEAPEVPSRADLEGGVKTTAPQAAVDTPAKDNKLRPAEPKPRLEPQKQQEKTTDETGNGADEAPAQPEQGVERPAEVEEPRPAEAGAQGAEAPREGVVGDTSVKNGTSSAETTENRPPTADINKNSAQSSQSAEKTTATAKKENFYKRTSRKAYDKTDGSGSIGAATWHYDNGDRIYNIPVDYERTQPGGRVVLKDTDSATERIKGLIGESRMKKLRLSKTGKIYFEGERGVPSDLQEALGRELKIGSNPDRPPNWGDLTGRRETQFEGMGESGDAVSRENTWEDVEKAVAKDRENYRKFVDATRRKAVEDREEADMRKKLEKGKVTQGEFDLWKAKRDLARYERDATAEGVDADELLNDDLYRRMKRDIEVMEEGGSYDYAGLSSAKDAADREWSEAIGEIASGDLMFNRDGEYVKPFSRENLKKAKAGDIIHFDHEEMEYMLDSYDPETGIARLWRKGEDGFSRMYKVSKNGIEELKDGRKNEEVSDQDHAGDEGGGRRGAAGGAGGDGERGEGRGADGGFTLESATQRQLNAETKRNRERADVRKRQEAPLKGGKAEDGQTLMDLGGAEGEDLFNRTAREEPKKPDNRLRPSAQSRIAKAYADYVEEPVPEWAKRLSAKDAEEYADLLERAQREGGEGDGTALDRLEAFENAHKGGKPEGEKLKPARTETKAESDAEGGNTAATSPSTPSPELRKRATAAMRVLGADAGRPIAELEKELAAIGDNPAGAAKRKADALRDLIEYKKATGTAEVDPNEVASAKRKEREDRIIDEMTEERLPSEDFYGRRENRAEEVPEGWSQKDKDRAISAANMIRISIPGVKDVRFSDEVKRNSNGDVVHGEFDRNTGVVTLYRGATPETSFHEIGGHALMKFAENEAKAGRPELLNKLNAAIDSAPEKTWNDIKDRYSDKLRDGKIEEVRDEVLADVFGKKGDRAFNTLEGRAWYNRVWRAIKDAWRGVMRKMGFDVDSVSMKKLDKVSPDKAVDWLIRQMMEGKKIDRARIADAVDAAKRSGKPVVHTGSDGRKVFVKGDTKSGVVIKKGESSDAELKHVFKTTHPVSTSVYHVGGKNGPEVHFWKNSSQEFVRSKNSSWLFRNDLRAFRAKMSLIPNLEQILENATLVNDHVKPTHVHAKHKSYYKDFDVYEIDLAIPDGRGVVGEYTGKVILNRHKNGTLYFYDILMNRKKGSEGSVLKTGVRTKPVPSETARNIAQTDGGVNEGKTNPKEQGKSANAKSAPPFPSETPRKITQPVAEVKGGAEENAKNPPKSGILESRAPRPPSGNGTSPSIMDEKESIFEKWTRNFSDRFSPIKSLQEMVRKIALPGADVPDPYYEKRVQPGHNEADRRAIDIIKDEYAQFLKDNKGKVTHEEMGQYLKARDALYRNPDMLARLNVANGAGISDAAARKIIDDFKAAGKIQTLDKGFRILQKLKSDFGLQRLVDGGMLDQDTATMLEKRNPDYAPQRTDWSEEDGGFDRNSTRSVESPALKRALGRSSEADNPVEFLFLQAEDNAARTNENRTRQEVAKLVRMFPEIGTVRTQRKSSAYDYKTGKNATIDDPMDREEKNPYIVAFRENGKKMYIEFAHTELGLKVANAIRGEGIVRSPEQFAALTRAWASTATQLSATFSGRNVVKDSIEVALNTAADSGLKGGAGFLKNQIADVKDVVGTLRTYIKTGKFEGKFGPMLKMFVDNGASIGGLGREGYQDVSGDIAKRARTFAGKFNLSGLRAKTGMVVDATFGRITAMNEIMEFLSRFNNFRNRIERAGANPSKEEVKEAVLASREDSTDFNRYGQQRWMNDVFMFSNSILGGTLRSGRQLVKNPKRGAALAGSILAYGFVEAMADAMINSDDDKEAEKSGTGSGKDLSERERSQTLFFRIGGKYFRIPMHAGPFSALKYTGGNIARAMLGRISWKDAMSMAGKEWATLGTHLSGIGEVDFTNGPKGTMESLTPSIIRPLVELAANQDYSGKKIYMPEGFDKYTPKSERAFRNTGDGYVAFARLLNRIGGGNENRQGNWKWLDNPPEAYKHIVEAVGKNMMRDIVGVGEVAENGIKLATGGGNEFDRNDIPFVRDTTRNVPDSTRRYYSAIEEYEKDKKEFKGTTDAARRKELRNGKPYLFAGKSLLDGQIEKVKEYMHLERGEVKSGNKWVEPKVPRTEAQKEEFRKKRLMLQARVLKTLGK